MPDLVEPLPSVAVLMSTYNGERFLEEQLASLAAQEGVRCELFVRDDGSTDATLAILARWADRWPQLAAPLTGPNLGPAMSFLELLKSAPADFDYVAFCDQDDVWLPGKLARAVDQLAALEGASPALYCSQVTCVDESLKPLGDPARNDDPRFEHLLFENIAYGITVVMDSRARVLLSRHPPKRGVIMHDWWCALVVSAFGKVVYDATPSVLYRQHGRNVVGARSSRASEVAHLAKDLWRKWERFYPIHAQASEFIRLFDDGLAPAVGRVARDLVASKATLRARLRYALSGPIERSRASDAIVARGLILAGLY